MPKLPWSERMLVEPDRTYVGLVSRLPLTSYRYLPGFLGDTTATWRQLRRTEGLVGFSLWAEASLKRFWTVSAWQDHEALRAFVVAEPHRSVMRRPPDRLGETAFQTFDVAGSELPVAWSTALGHLD